MFILVGVNSHPKLEGRSALLLLLVHFVLNVAPLDVVPLSHF